MTQQRLSFGARGLTQEDNSEHPDTREDVQDATYDFTTTTGGSNRAVQVDCQWAGVICIND